MIHLDRLVSAKMQADGILHKEAAELSDYVYEIGRQYFLKSAEYKTILEGLTALDKLIGDSHVE